MKKLKVLFTLFLLLSCMVVGAKTVRAGGVVGNGTPGSCTEAAFNTALSGGGTITFNCGPAPHTIVLTGQKSINSDTTIEGGNLITLSGGNSTRLFDVGATLILRDIVLTNGYFNGDGGAIRNNANGTLALDNVTLQNSSAALSGGAIVSYGPLNILASTLTGNTALNGGALYLRFSSSQTNITNSTLSNNQATATNPNGLGGAILVWDDASLTIKGSMIDNNSAEFGGGLYAHDNSILQVEDSTLMDNQAGLFGGGIENDGTTTLTRTTINGNVAMNSGGGLKNYFGLVILTDVTLSNNTAIFAGGMDNWFGTTNMTNVTFSKNIVSGGGGGMQDSGDLTANNVTFSGNIADKGGGLLIFDSEALLTNVTISDNNATTSGNGIYYKGIDPNRNLTFKNTVLANRVSGENCIVASDSVHGIASAGFNLSSDTSCDAYFTQPTDQTNVDPLLGPLAANGGFTMTHLPAPNSPIIDKGQCLAQIPTDQRGVARPQGPACDIGSVEVQVLGNFRAFVPIVLR